MCVLDDKRFTKKTAVYSAVFAFIIVSLVAGCVTHHVITWKQLLQKFSFFVLHSLYNELIITG